MSPMVHRHRSHVARVGVLLSARVFGVPDCDGSTPKSDWCATDTACQAPAQTPQTQEWYCLNSAISRQFIQHECNDGSGTGSTLCGTPEGATPLVCTKRYTCEYSELKDPETGEVTQRLCAQPLGAGGTNNSTASPTNYLTCNDTTGG